MKIALLGDTHRGVKRDDEWVVNYQNEFMDFFHKECKARKVTKVIQTGDWFDTRRGVTQECMHQSRAVVAPLLQDIGETFVAVGNHDMHKRESITPNSCREILGNLKKFTIIEEPTTITLGGVVIDIIPWICRENKDRIMEFVKNSESEYCVGHFELKGYYFYTGLSSDGDDPKFLDKYKEVWSGHFHCQSTGGNVRYLGTPYTLTSGDANDSRGFFIFDTQTKELEFVENPKCMHHKIMYNADTFHTLDLSLYENTAVRLVVEKRTTDDGRDLLDDHIMALSNVVHNLDVIDNFEFTAGEEDEIDLEDTTTYIESYIDSLEESDEVKARCKTIINGLQVEAREME